MPVPVNPGGEVATFPVSGSVVVAANDVIGWYGQGIPYDIGATSNPATISYPVPAAPVVSSAMTLGVDPGFPVFPQARTYSLAATVDPGAVNSVGSPLVGRGFASDGPGVFGVLPGAQLPAGVLRSFQVWNQASKGSAPYPSAGKVFHAYVLRPVSGVPNRYTVIYDSGALTMPVPVNPGGEVATFPVSGSVVVAANDVIGWYGQGIPYDIGATSNPATISYPVPAAPVVSSAMTLGVDPGFPVFPQARTYSLAATVDPGAVNTVGNSLVGRGFASDGPGVFGVLPGAQLPAGVLRSFQVWNQASKGSAPYPSAGKVFHAYVLRPVSGVPNRYTVIYDSGALTMPVPVNPGGEVATFPVSGSVVVAANDVIGWYGQGIPYDIGATSNPATISYPVPAAPVVSSAMTLGVDPGFPVFPQARTYSLAATVDPGAVNTVGHSLVGRGFGSDGPGVFGVLPGAQLPAGVLRSFQVWNQASKGSAPYPSAGKVFHAYVLRPVSGVPNRYTVIYDSGALTMPVPVNPGGEVATFPVSGSVVVAANDVIGWYGQGIPYDIGATSNPATISYPVPAAPVVSSAMTLGVDPGFPVFPQARTYSLAATVDPGAVNTVGNSLVGRGFGSDGPGVFGVLPGAQLPAGVLRSFQVWNQASKGSAPYPSAGKVFHAYVLRPVSGVPNRYTVIYDSGALTMPVPVNPGGEVATFPVSGSVVVAANDVIGWYGQGIPYDIGATSNPATISYPVPAAPVVSSAMTLGVDPGFPVFPQARTYSLAATVDPGAVNTVGNSLVGRGFGSDGPGVFGVLPGAQLPAGV